MKKLMSSWLIMLLALFFCTGLISCKDDEGESSDTEILIGTWRNYEGNHYTDEWTFYKGGHGLGKEYSDGILNDSYGFSWKKENNTLTIIENDDNDIDSYTIIALTPNILVFMDEYNNTYTYNKVTEEDSENENQDDQKNNYQDLLAGHWSYENENLRELFSFNYNGEGSIAYSYNNYTENSEYEISAYGTYVIDGNTLTARYTDVNVYTSYGSKTYKGFTDGQNKIISYTIVSCDGNFLILKDSDRTLTIEKYKDL